MSLFTSPYNSRGGYRRRDIDHGRNNNSIRHNRSQNDLFVSPLSSQPPPPQHKHNSSRGGGGAAPPVRSLAELMGVRSPSMKRVVNRGATTDVSLSSSSRLTGAGNLQFDTITATPPTNTRTRPPRHPTTSTPFAPVVSPILREPEVSPLVTKNDMNRVVNQSAHMNTSLAADMTTSTHHHRIPKSNAITVFGFPPSAAWKITERFQRFGEIIRRWHGSGNWLHIQYKRVADAEQALTQNGRRIEDNLMIGVQPLDENLFSDDFMNNPANLDFSSTTTSTSDSDHHNTSIFSAGMHQRRQRNKFRPHTSLESEIIDGAARPNICTRMYNWILG